MSSLTRRWTPLKPHPEQIRLWNSTARFNIVTAGRRSGKTELSKRKLVRRALYDLRFPRGAFFAAAPTRTQAKDIYWDDLIDLIPSKFILGSPKVSTLEIQLVNGNKIKVLGLDKPARIEGTPWNGGLLDEYGNMKDYAWTAHVRPALSDRLGWCDFIGVPEGRNHYFDLYDKYKDGSDPDWNTFYWKSADILPESEIIAAKRDLDEDTFKQEYEAEFVNFTGLAYYNFTDNNLGPVDYNPDCDLIFCFDFNVSPGVAAICQEQVLPNGMMGTAFIGEVWIPRFSNTQMVCDRLINDWCHHAGKVRIYGDATGGYGSSAQLQGNDWEIVQRTLAKEFAGRMSLHVSRSNPSERSRINAVNSRIRTMDGGIKLMVNPISCKHLTKDFRQVMLLLGGRGQIDKRTALDLTHISDAAGYYIAKEFPVRDNRAKQTEMF